MTTATRNDKAVLDVIREVVDNAAAGKVFAAPITSEGITVLPVAKVSGGGGGGGGGSGPAREGHETGGTGGGLGVSAKPLGVYVIKEGEVKWRPAIDLNRIVLGGQMVAIAALLVVRALLRARAKA